MKTRTATIIAAALALTFTAACGDGSFGMDEGASSAQQEIRGGNGGGGKTSGYNCKRDHQLDVPPTLNAATALTSMQLNLNASPGSDESGTARITSFSLVDEAGTIQRIAPEVRSGCSASRSDDVSDFTIAPLEPGARYQVSAIARDLCGNTASSNTIEVVMPQLGDDATPPSILKVRTARVSLYFASMPGLAAYASDGESDIDRVEFLVNGEYMRDYSYEDRLHGWSDPEGEVYFTNIGSQYWGQTVEVTAVAYDVFGNSFSRTETLTVPSS